MGKGCAVLDCTSTSSPNMASLYRLPNKGKTKDSWMKFLTSINSKWMWQPTDIMYVCSAHFESKYVINGLNGNTRISKIGFPTLMNGQCIPEMKGEDQMYQVSSQTIALDNEQQQIDMLKRELQESAATIDQLNLKLELKDKELKEARAKLKVANQLLKRRDASGKRKLARDEEVNSKKTKLDDDELLRFLDERIESVELREIVKRAVTNKTNLPYSDILKEFSYRLHYYAGKGYEVLRKAFNKCVPSIRSFQSWTEHVKSDPGFLPQSLQYLQKLHQASPYKQYYALSVDEIHIRRQIIHKGDGFIGYTNYGGIIEEDDNEQQKVASAALFVLATCINGTHKVPICYILTNGLKSHVLAEVVKQSIAKLEEVNGVVLSVTFDGLPANFKAMTNLGANLNIHDKNFKPFLRDPERPIDVHLIPDVCHMYKLFRNLFKKYGVLKNFRGQEIKWVHIHRLQQLQDKEGLKAANKLSWRHVNFELQKMKTRLCLQVMSKSVATALLLCRTLGIQGFEDSAATEEFLLLMNALFDVLNSRRGGVGIKTPLNRAAVSEIMPFFAMMKYYLFTLKVNEKGKEKLLVKSKKQTAAKGLIVAINSVEQILISVMGEETCDLKYLPTYKLSQDKIELFFGTLRSRFGKNNNPNVVQLGHAVKGILCMKAKCIVEGNCANLEEDDCTRICTFQNINTILDENENFLYEESNENEILPDLSAYSGNVVGYIAGNVGYKLCRKQQCSCCILNLVANEQDWDHIKGDCLLIDLKNAGGLFYPSFLLLSLCKIADQVYRMYEHVGLNNISKNVLLQVIKHESASLSVFWRTKEEQDNCNHFEEIVSLVGNEYLKVKLHHVAREASLKDNPTSTRNFHNRLVITSGG